MLPILGLAISPMGVQNSVAMLVPHEFKREGDGYVLQYNPEALELFVMQKVFTISRWLKSRGIDSTAKLQQMTQSLGYEIDSAFFQSLINP
jgi:hypothetical protein